MTTEERRQKIYAEINARAELMAREREKAETKNRRPLTRKPKIAAWVLAIVMLIGLLALPYILAGGLYVLKNTLGEARRQGLPHWELVEYIEVEGECAEDHVKVSDPYTGHIELMRHVTTDHQWGAGYVTHRRNYSHDAVMERTSDPYRYEPSFWVGFTNLRPDELQGDVLQLAGLSEFLWDEMTPRPSYRATCMLRVIRRLDHRPSWQEDIPH